MSAQLLHEIEARISALTVPEKRRLLERLTDEVRRATDTRFTASLATMAADPEVQQELRRIRDEFASTEEDGLERL